MIRALFLPLAALLLVGCAGPQAPPPAGPRPTVTLGAEERQGLLQELEQTRGAFLAAVQGLSEAQLRFRPAPDRWSVAEVVEHLALSEERIFAVVTDKALRAPPPPELRPGAPRDDERVRQAMRDRGSRRQAPEALRPTGSFPSVAAALDAFSARRARTVAFVGSTREDLRGHGAPHPVFQLLDGYQWLLVLSGHCARHTAQIEELKADPAFPRS